MNEKIKLNIEMRQRALKSPLARFLFIHVITLLFCYLFLCVRTVSFTRIPRCLRTKTERFYLLHTLAVQNELVHFGG